MSRLFIVTPNEDAGHMFFRSLDRVNCIPTYVTDGRQHTELQGLAGCHLTIVFLDANVRDLDAFLHAAALVAPHKVGVAVEAYRQLAKRKDNPYANFLLNLCLGGIR